MIFFIIKVSQLLYNTAFAEQLWKLEPKPFGHEHGNECQLRKHSHLVSLFLHLASLGALGLNSLAQLSDILSTEFHRFLISGHTYSFLS